MVTGSLIPRRIYIPFKPEYIPAVFSGRMTATTRPKKYGSPGDYFYVTRKRFRLTLVMKVSLRTVAVGYYREENFKTPGDFIQAWIKLHPVLQWRPRQEVWIHFFEEVKE